MTTTAPRPKVKDMSVREHLDAAERHFDRAVAKAESDYEVDMVRNRLTGLLKDITPS